MSFVGVVEASVMIEGEADQAAVENACRDIDRSVAETSAAAASSKDNSALSPSERMRALGQQKAHSFVPETPADDAAAPAAEETSDATLPPNKF
jgi:hypothetical protein